MRAINDGGASMLDNWRIGMEKTETGVMVMKDGKAWGTSYEDGYSTSYGWINPAEAEIHEPESCTKTTDVTYENSPYIEELRTGKLVMVERKTVVRIMEAVNAR